MPAPLRTIMVALWVTCLAGAVLTAFFSYGWYGWVPFAISGAIGVIVGVPAGIWTARQIKRDDPNWPRRKRKNP
ncbi:hypothetical protein OEW28_06945 [Defluviimonas sp. WL0002]|uniref:DUF2530 domain-containing protein n=1 Tax=Albidovulum marisflavi TaxID=2984159 RepID=A0ABT2ZB43_9RHOB|nr:hypothetical protein [Defluviimonas sp. WL0002]MCV2868363.1 hypothetical protein [Defluviimonas sp. WL0002]